MEKIPVKQIEGAVDLNSTQTIGAKKHFNAGLSISKGQVTHFPYLKDGYLYYQRAIEQLQDNDFRLGVNPDTGVFTLQQLTGGVWLNSCVNGCFQSPYTTPDNIMVSIGGISFGTPVLLSNGNTRSAELIEIGDLVSAVQNVSGLGTLLSALIYVSPTTVASKVIGIQKSVVEYYYKINTTILLSARHHVLCDRSGVYQFVKAENLVLNEKILNFSMGWIRITSLARMNQPISMVSLKLENQDTYVASGIVVRNIQD